LIVEFFRYPRAGMRWAAVFLFALFVLALYGGQAQAQDKQKTAPGAVTLDANSKADIKRIEDYLNSITTMRAKFQQYSDNGGLAFGHIYLRRPGFARIEYDPPQKILLVADSIALSYYDAELDHLEQVPLRLSPLWFLLRDKVRLGGDVTVTSFQRLPGAFRIGIVQSDTPDAGSVVLELGDRPLELRQWSITDEKGGTVRIGLFDAEFGVSLDNALFRTPTRKSQSN